MIIPRIEPRDEPRWRVLWDGYNYFYGREPSEPVTRQTWSRILDPSHPTNAIVATNRSEAVIGIANYLVHDVTAALSPVCYLRTCSWILRSALQERADF
ncbi:MAG: hypothetical protein ACRD59_12150 [Candidatus Acidiferrales bacterium]